MRRRHRKLTVTPELDITAFMNLMIVLVPVLLLGMVFSQIRTIELNFPGLAAGEAPAADDFRLTVTLLQDGLEVADNERGLIQALPLVDGEQNYAGLQDLMVQIKQAVPDKTDVILEVAPGIEYQALITVMDTLRSYEAVVAASVVDAELFPDVALADTSEERTLTVALTGGLQ